MNDSRDKMVLKLKILVDKTADDINMYFSHATQHLTWSVGKPKIPYDLVHFGPLSHPHLLESAVTVTIKYNDFQSRFELPLFELDMHGDDYLRHSLAGFVRKFAAGYFMKGDR